MNARLPPPISTPFAASRMLATSPQSGRCPPNRFVKPSPASETRPKPSRRPTRTRRGAPDTPSVPRSRSIPVQTAAPSRWAAPVQSRTMTADPGARRRTRRTRTDPRAARALRHLRFRLLCVGPASGSSQRASALRSRTVRLSSSSASPGASARIASRAAGRTQSSMNLNFLPQQLRQYRRMGLRV